MAYFIGAIVGSVFGMLLLGTLAAWIIRKITGIAEIPSYVLSVSILAVIGPWSVTYDGGPSFLENFILYVIGAAIALPLMIVGDRRKRHQAI